MNFYSPLGGKSRFRMKAEYNYFIADVSMKKSLLVSLLSLTFVGFAQAQDISGPQSGTLGPGTYTVIGDISVRNGETLQIVPGTDFLHTGYYTWTIEGLLTAQGTMGDSIKFVRQNPINEHRWGGLRFQSSASPDCILDYCIIDNCKNTGSATSGGGIYSAAAITISNSRISNCQTNADGGGISVDEANITVDHCLIVNNAASNYSNGGGIYLNATQNALITQCVIAHNSATGT